MKNFTKLLMAGAAVIAMSAPAHADSAKARTGLGLGVDTGVVSTSADVDARVKARNDMRGNSHARVHSDADIDSDGIIWNNSRARAGSRMAGSSNAAVRSDLDSDVKLRGLDNRARVNANANPSLRAYGNANANARFMDDYDMSSADTRDLQMRLKRAGYQVSADGVLGSRTRAAIAEYQMDNNLEATGVLDNDTLDLLNSGTIMSRTNVRNRADFSAMSRSDIRDLQLRLDDAGYNLSADGYVGTRTRAALRDYQAANNLAVTGRLDAATKASLNLN